MRRSWPLLLLLPALAAAQDLRLAPLNAMIDRGQPRRAAPAFRAMLAEDPSDHAARAGLGRALAAMNRCDEALIHLGAAFPTEGWSAKAATAEADCHWRAGDLTSARAALEEAVLMNANLVPARYDLTRVLLELGDFDAAEEQIEELASGLQETHRARILELLLAMTRGDDPWSVLGRLQGEVDSDPTEASQQQAYYLEGWLWMQAGDPDGAVDLFSASIQVMTAHEDSILSRAEAFRRTGQTYAAREVAWRRSLRTSPLLHAFRARVLVDEGDLVAAAEELALAANPDAAETLASAWYLERARGGDLEPIEQAWEACAHLYTRDLSRLIPLEAP